MAKCPKCGEELKFLRNYSKAEEVFIFTVDEGGKPDYEHLDVIPGSDNDWECPECKKVLFTDEEKATEFLKGR